MSHAEPTEVAYTRQLAEFIDRTRYDNLTAAAIARAKSVILDTVGCMCLGSTRTQVAALRRVVADLGGDPHCTLVGSRQRASLQQTALVGGFQASGSRLLEDTFLESFGHPGVAVIPAMLAAGERAGASGRDLLLSVVLGYEMSIRASAAVTWKTLDRGWHPRGTANVFGAATAAGKLLGLQGTDAWCAALGLAGMQAGGLFEGGSPYDGWYLLSGAACQNGVMAALMAREGLTAGYTILEGARGFCQAFSPAPNLPRLTEGLGQRFEIVQITQKRHGSSSLTHPPMDAVLELKAEHGLRPQDVGRIDIYTFNVFYLHERIRPTSQMEGGHSLPYLVALMLTDGEALDPQFDDAHFGDPVIGDLFDRIHVHVDPDLTARLPRDVSARVVLHTKDGRVLEKTRYWPHGEPRDPLTADEVRSKYLRHAVPVLGAAQAAQLWETVQRLEQVERASDLVRLLVPAP